MNLLCLMLAVGATSQPAYAFLAPVGDVWQVWAAADGGSPRAITTDAQEKISLSAAARTGEVLALTRDGRGILLGPGGEVTGNVDLGEGAGEASLSPDGLLIAYVREGNAPAGRKRHLWVFDRKAGRGRPIVRRPGMQHSPAWSPDGVSVAFTASGESGGEDLWLLRLDGSDERQLTAGPHRHFEPSIAPDGGIYISSNRGGDYDISRIDPGSQDLRPIVARKGYDGQPRVSPEGGRILFVSGSSGRRAVWIANADGSGARALTDGTTGVRDPVWLASVEADGGAGAGKGEEKKENAAGEAESPDAQGWIAFLRVTDGRWQPWAVRPDGSGLQRLADLPADLTRVTLSADGRRLLADAIDGSLFLVTTADGKARPVQIDPPGPTDAALSADGRFIAYSVNTLGGIDSNDLWVVTAEGGRAKKVTDQPYLQHFPAWSPGGDILYLSGKGGQSHDIWSVSPDSGKASLVVGERLYNFEPAVSSKGDLAFSSNREGNYDIWILPAGSGEPRRLTRDPAYDGQPTFSTDGKEIAFVSRRGGAGRIWIHEVATGRERPLPVEGEVRMPFWYAGGPADATRGAAAEDR